MSQYFFKVLLLFIAINVTYQRSVTFAFETLPHFHVHNESFFCQESIEILERAYNTRGKVDANYHPPSNESKGCYPLAGENSKKPQTDHGHTTYHLHYHCCFQVDLGMSWGAFIFEPASNIRTFAGNGYLLLSGVYHSIFRPPIVS